MGKRAIIPHRVFLGSSRCHLTINRISAPFCVKILSIQKKKITKQLQVGNLPCGHVCKINLFKHKDFYAALRKAVSSWQKYAYSRFSALLSFRAWLTLRKVRFSLFHRKYIFDIISMKKKTENPLF
jgi:hypothetical protein